MYRFVCSFLLGLFFCFAVDVLPNLQLSISAEEVHEAASSHQEGFTSSLTLENNPKKLGEKALADFALGQYNRAITQWEQLLQSSEGIDKAITHANLGAAYRQIGKLSEAIKHWEQAIQIYRASKDNDSPGLVAALTDQAQAYNALGQFRQGMKRSLEAIDIAHQNQDRKTEAVAQGALGNAYSIAGDYEQALIAYSSSLKLADAINNRVYMATALNNQANILNTRSKRYASQASSAGREGNQEEQLRMAKLADQDKIAAFDAAARAVKESKASGGILEVRSLLNMARLVQQSPSSKQGLIDDYYKQTIEILKRQPDSRSKAYTLINLAEVQEEPESLKTLKWAITVAKNIGDSRAESFALGATGGIYELRGELAKALELTHQAQFTAQEVNAGDSLYRWQWQAGRIHKASGQPEKATLSYKQAIATLQRIRSDIVTANKELQFDVRDEVEPVYRELMELLLDNSQNKSSDIKEALEFSELLKLNELQSFFGDECLEVAEAIAQPEEVIAKTNDAVINSIILNQKTYMVLRLPDGLIKSYAVPVTAQQLQSKIKRFRLLLEDYNTEEYRTESEELYNLLIRPMEDVLAKFKPSTLLFVNDGVLRNVPMAALHDGQQFLVEKYPIAATLSTNFISSEKQQQNQPGLVFGLTTKIPPFASLPFVDTETKIVHNILGGSKFLNEDFTLNKLKDEIQEKYPIVHLATHGKFGGTYTSTFLQAFDQRISLEELEELIRNREEPIELLTLSACQTAAGDNRATLGLGGLAVRAGVENVLATLWAINDADTLPLIKNFYTQLRQPGITKAEALRNTQIMAITNPVLEHPYIWSPFILIGKG